MRTGSSLVNNYLLLDAPNLEFDFSAKILLAESNHTLDKMLTITSSNTQQK